MPQQCQSFVPPLRAQQVFNIFRLFNQPQLDFLGVAVDDAARLDLSDLGFNLDVADRQ